MQCFDSERLNSNLMFQTSNWTRKTGFSLFISWSFLSLSPSRSLCAIYIEFYAKKILFVQVNLNFMHKSQYRQYLGIW